MDLFNTKLQNLRLKESIIDIERSDLDPTVFQYIPNKNLPILQPSIKMQILEDLGHIQEIVSIASFFIVGSILTKKYSESSDIDVCLELPPEEITDYNYEQLLSTLNHLNGRLAVGTTHPINYKVIKQPTNFDNFDAVYDIVNEQWLKEPVPVQTDVEKYIDRFETEIASIDLNAGKLRREIIDMDYLKSLKPNQIRGLRNRVESKLKQVENTINSLVDTYKNVKKLRNLAYAEPWDAEKVKNFGIKNNLPQNVIYKLLEKYYYLDFMRKLKAILAPKRELKTTDIDKIKNAFVQAFLRGFTT